MSIVHSPYDGRVVGEAPELDRREVDELLDAGAAYESRLSRYERSEILDRVAARIAGSADEVAAMITGESGLALRDAGYEVRRATDVFRFAAMEALRDDGQI